MISNSSNPLKAIDEKSISDSSADRSQLDQSRSSGKSNNNELAVMSMIGFSIKKQKSKRFGIGNKDQKMKVMEELET